MPNIGHVVGVQLYARDAVVVRHGHAPTTHDTPRGEVTEFTDKSRARLAFVANNTAVVFRTMITLTYPKEFPKDGKLVKQHLARFLQAWRRYTRGASYLWFLEFQRRGAPHVHILTDWPITGGKLGKKSVRLWVSRKWYTTCGELDPKHLVAGTQTARIRNTDNPGAYAVKYASKMEQKRVPPDYRNVGRFWGHTRDVTPKPYFDVECSEDDLRAALVGTAFEPPRDRPVWRVLYNKSAHLAAEGVDGFDKRDSIGYTVAEQQATAEPDT